MMKRRYVYPHGIYRRTVQNQGCGAPENPHPRRAASRTLQGREEGYNLFNPSAPQDVYIDLMTDSGTGAMSQNQWAAMIDRRRGLRRRAELLPAAAWMPVSEIFGYAYFQPVHQGRAAEKVFHAHHAFRRQGRRQQYVFRYHPRARGACMRHRAGLCRAPRPPIPIAIYPFKGNMDIGLLKKSHFRATARKPYRHDRDDR